MKNFNSAAIGYESTVILIDKRRLSMAYDQNVV